MRRKPPLLAIAVILGIGVPGITLLVFWLQGWNEQFNDSPYTAEQMQAEYADNLKDLIFKVGENP